MRARCESGVSNLVLLYPHHMVFLFAEENGRIEGGCDLQTFQFSFRHQQIAPTIAFEDTVSESRLDSQYKKKTHILYDVAAFRRSSLFQPPDAGSW